MVDYLHVNTYILSMRFSIFVSAPEAIEEMQQMRDRYPFILYT